MIKTKEKQRVIEMNSNEHNFITNKNYHPALERLAVATLRSAPTQIQDDVVVLLHIEKRLQQDTKEGRGG